MAKQSGKENGVQEQKFSKKNQRSLEDYIKQMDDEEEFSLDADDGIFLIPYQNFIEFFTNLYINIDFPEEWSGVRFSSAWT